MAERQKKISLFGSFKPDGIDPTAGAKSSALAGIANDISIIASQEASRQGAKLGIKEGRQAVSEGDDGITVSELGEDFTARGQARHKAAQIAYKSSIKRSAKQKINQLMQESPDDLNSFSEKIDAYISGTLEAAPEEMAAVVKDDLLNYSASAKQQVSNNEFKATQQELGQALVNEEENLTDDLTNAARAGDEDALNDVLTDLREIYQTGVENGILTGEDVKAKMERVRESVITQSTIGDMENILNNESLSVDQRLEEAGSFVKEIESSKELSATQNETLKDTVEARLNQFVVQQSKEQRRLAQENAKNYSNLLLAAKHGSQEMDAETILSKADSMLDQGLISGAQRTAVFDHVINRQTGTVKTNISHQKFIQRLNGDSRKILTASEMDKSYDELVAPEIEGMPPLKRIEAVTNVVDKLRHIPKSEKQRLRLLSRSSDIEDIKEASMMFNALQEVPGLQQDEFDAKEWAYIDLVSDLSLNMEPEKAVEIAKDLTHPDSREIVDKRTELLNQAVKDEDIVYADIFDDLVEVEGVNKPIAMKEFESVFNAYYKSNPDTDKAAEAAAKVINRTWKESALGYKMKLPPDLFYPDASGRTDYIQKDLLSTVNSTLFHEDIKKGGRGANFISEPLKSDEVFLLTDLRTQQEAKKGKPSYLVYYKKRDGTMGLVRNADGVVQRYVPDIEARNKAIRESNFKKSEVMQDVKQIEGENREVTEQPGFARGFNF